MTDDGARAIAVLAALERLAHKWASFSKDTDGPLVLQALEQARAEVTASGLGPSEAEKIVANLEGHVAWLWNHALPEENKTKERIGEIIAEADALATHIQEARDGTIKGAKQ